MSGIITPILDTLLHEVLGKRVEGQANRDFLAPVKPLSTGHAPRALHSDSRLNAEQSAPQRQSSLGDKAFASPNTESSSSSAPASTRTHFSAAARSIADILVKFPAPPSVLRPPIPLVVAGEVVEPTQLASRLRQSIETSGLFYESHLARWHRGDIPRLQLQQEPQMQLFLQRSQSGAPAMLEGQGHAPVTGARASDAAQGRAQPQVAAPLIYAPPTSSTSTTQHPLIPMQVGDMPTAQSPTLNPADEARELPRTVVSNGDALADDVLQSIVRHQLELMVTPALRWEGDLWSGVFMALAIHVPEVLERHANDGNSKEDQESEPDEAVWHSELTLQLPSLGTLGVNFYLRGRSLNMTLECADEATVSTLRAESRELEARFSRCGLDDVKVSILPKRDEPDGKEPA